MYLMFLPSQFFLLGKGASKISKRGKKMLNLLRVGFEPTPFRTRTLIWRLRPTRPSQQLVLPHIKDIDLSQHSKNLTPIIMQYRNMNSTI
jgi:hypothetical protein